MRWRIRSAILRFVAALVVALHGALLWQRIDDRSILQPEVLARWLAAAAVGGAALVLLRRRASRRAWLGFWLAVFLLHAAPLPDAAIFTVVGLLLLAAGDVSRPLPAASRFEVRAAAVPRSSVVVSLATRAPPRW